MRESNSIALGLHLSLGPGGLVQGREVFYVAPGIVDVDPGEELFLFFR